MRKVWAALLLGVGLWLIPLLPQPGWAASVIFYACVDAHTGLLYNQYKGTHPRCKPGDTVTSWNQAGPRGFQGLPGPGAVVKDANGVVVGVLGGDFTHPLRNVGDTVVEVPVNLQGFVQFLELYYESTDCSGSALVDTNHNTTFTSRGQVLGTTLYYPPNPGRSPDIIVPHSVAVAPISASNCTASTEFFVPPNTCCGSGSFGVQFLVPPATAELSGFTPPFHLEVQP